MARLIGLDFEADRVTAVELVGGKTPSVSARFQATLPGALTVKNAESMGAWLKDGLGKAGFRATDVVVVLSRSRINFKLLDVPNGPVDELPAMVSFAVEGDLASPAGDGILDFQAASNGDGMTALAAMAAAEEVNAISAAIKVAKLNCRHIAPRAFGDHYAAEQSFDLFGHHPALVVAPQADLVEISTWRTDSLTAYRSIPLSAGEVPGKRIATEVRRTLAAVRSGDRPLAVERIGVIGNGPELAQAIKDATHMAVQHIDPCVAFGAEELSNQPGYTAAMVAAWRELADAEWPIDFANPKKPVVRRDARRPSLIMAGALALLLPVGAYSYAKYLESAKGHRIAFMAEQIRKLEKDLALKQPMLSRHREIKKWVDGEVNWAHELHALASVLPDTTDVFLTKLEMVSNDNRGDGQKPGTIKMEGLVRDPSVITDASLRLASDTTGHYSPTPKGSRFTTERTDYQHSFGVDLAVTPLNERDYREIAKAGTEKYAKSVPAGKRRDPVALGTMAAAKSAVGNNGQSEAASGARPLANGVDSGSRGNRTSRSFSPPTVEASASPAVDPVDRFVSQLKDLSFEEREKFINGKVPSFLRARVRKKLQETKP